MDRELSYEQKKEIFSKRLQNARKICVMSQAGLAEKTKEMAEKDSHYKSVSSTAIERYENGVMLPDSEAVMKTLADALETTVENLMRPFTVSIDFSRFEFRKKSKLGKKAQEAIILKIQQRVEKYVEIEQLIGEEPKFDVDFSSQEVRTFKDACDVAKMLRIKWHLGMGPIPQPIYVLEMNGVKVIEVEEDSPDFDGTSNMVEGIPVIVINSKDYSDRNGKKANNEERRRLTLFHELGHQVMNIPEDITDNKTRENLCNAFANEMLLPSETFKQIIGKKRNSISFAELKSVQESFGISVRAIMIKASQLEVISQNRHTGFCKMLNNPVYSKIRNYLDGSLAPQQHASRFSSLVYRALTENTISKEKAADLLSVPIDEINEKVS